MDLTNMQELLPLFIMFGGLGSDSQGEPASPSDMFPMLFMMKAMESPDGQYRTTIEEQIALAMQYEMLIRQRGSSKLFTAFSLLSKFF